VSKGEYVQAGDLLLRLDDELSQSQQQRALTALEAAQANLTTAQAGVEMAEATLRAAEVSLETANASAEAELIPLKQALDKLYETLDVARAEAEKQVADANRAVREAQYRVDIFDVPTNQQDLTAMEGVILMKERLDQAREAFEPYKYYASGNPTRQDLKEALDEAQSDYDSAVRRLENESALNQAQALLEQAQRDLDALQEGPDPDEVAALEAGIAAIEALPKQAEVAVIQAEKGVTQAQALLGQAERLVAQAQAELDLIEVQIGKLSLYAPTSGMVLNRSVEQGEVVQAGAPLMTIGQLEDLSITVYVPEDLYGRIDVGQTARVIVDSFPGENFSARVVHIADQAEFTPRNVQTAEGRRTTVFAVELVIEDVHSKLKPGMPADVSFE
jgi:HlyD family secretion protein